ncbi:MAG: CoA transferase [Hyphomicrobiaceae bacterium]|nr:CoA transferase [Hyphomicrobiaceae bacterium]
MSKTDKSELPLSGIRVLDLATFIAAPFAASTMAEFGAEVIKIERPDGGDPWRRYGTPKDGGDSLAWKSEARNKRSVTLNLRHPEGAELLKKLVAGSDVVCENFRPGTLEKWGLGWDVLSAVNPGLIMLRVSGYGQDGPYRDRPGFARIAHAYGGLTHLAGMPGGPPVTPGSTSLADYATGLYGTVGVLMALRHRDRTGRGQVVDLSLYESIFRVLDELAPAYAEAGIIRGREGTKTLNAVPHGHFEAKDGKWLALSCTSDVMFARLCELMGRPELAMADMYGEVGRRLQHYDDVEKITADYIKEFDRDDFLSRCVEFEVPAAPVNSIAEIFADPHFKARGTLTQVKDWTGNPVTMPDVVPRLSETPGHVETTGPELGEGTADILARLCGITDDDLARLKREGVI